MPDPLQKIKPLLETLQKSPTGIKGLDEITGGGLPQGRPTLVCGGTGCGKTLLAMEFLVRGAIEYDEPGVYMSFEEKAEELTQNFASLGFDLNEMVARQKLALDFIYIERSEIEETGIYNLDGIFIRIGLAIDTIGAKRIVLDTIESLFTGFSNEVILRAELRRLFRFLKRQGPYRCYYRRARGGDADPLRPRGICRRLRDLPQPQSGRSDCDAAPAHRQVPRFYPRH